MQILKNCRRFYRLWLFNYRGSLQIFPETISRKVKYLAKRENQKLAREAKTPKNPACRCLGPCMPLASAWHILGKRYAIICHRMPYKITVWDASLCLWVCLNIWDSISLLPVWFNGARFVLDKPNQPVNDENPNTLRVLQRWMITLVL
jgi:hypothetical protein